MVKLALVPNRPDASDAGSNTFCEGGALHTGSENQAVSTPTSRMGRLADGSEAASTINMQLSRMQHVQQPADVPELLAL